MITLEDDRLVFRVPKVHEEAVCSIGCQRTLRIPDDDRTYPLPPGLGRFPLRHLDDFAARAPKDWRRRGGVVMPMYQAEAMWLDFDVRALGDYPFAVKVGTGKIDAVTGEAWVDNLNRDPQDYLVLPEQPWLDGYCVEKGSIRQFVAMPLGAGYSAEEQLTGVARWGGLQLVVYPMKAERYRAKVESLRQVVQDMRADKDLLSVLAAPSMGLAAGGRMRQTIHEDPYHLDDWDQRHASRCFVTIVNSTAWFALSGETPPCRAPSAADYASAGLPWFDVYDGDAKALEGAATLAGLESVAKISGRKNDGLVVDEDELPPLRVHKLRSKRRERPVREPNW